jgi:hypothetical protein
MWPFKRRYIIVFDIMDKYIESGKVVNTLLFEQVLEIREKPADVIDAVFIAKVEIEKANPNQFIVLRGVFRL